MPRSPVLTGLQKQLNRSKVRKRRDKKTSLVANNNDDRLFSWLQKNVPLQIERIESLNLSLFLQQTNHIKISSAERLRKLAIFLEDQLEPNDYPIRYWLAINRIYLAALKLNAQNKWIYHSQALTALYFADIVLYDTRKTWKLSPKRQRVMKVAYQAANNATQIDPGNDEIIYLLGQLHYCDPDYSTQKALYYFEKALDINRLNQWSLLYKAHCLHDMKYWRQAAITYQQVNPSFFTKSRCWRYEILLEQKAYCWFKANEIKKAKAQFEVLINRWEKNTSLARKNHLGYILEATKKIDQSLYQRVIAINNSVSKLPW